MEYTYKLSYGDVGADIRRLQEFLISKGASLSPDGHFGPKTRDAVTAWQHDHGLNQTGAVDKVTRESLGVSGFVVRTLPSASAQTGTNWPAKPASPPQPNPKLTESLFGRFNFVLSPTPDNPERIEIQDNWIEDNIVTLNIPELDNCLFAEGNTYTMQPVGRIRCHKLAAPKFMQLSANTAHASGSRPDPVANDPGRVKTQRQSIAIDQVTRSRPFHLPTSQAHSILRSKSRISFSSRFELLSFHTAWTHSGPFHPKPLGAF